MGSPCVGSHGEIGGLVQPHFDRLSGRLFDGAAHVLRLPRSPEPTWGLLSPTCAMLATGITDEKKPRSGVDLGPPGGAPTLRLRWPLQSETLDTALSSPSGTRVGIADRGRVRVFDVATGRELVRLNDVDTSAAAFSADGTQIAFHTTREDRGIQVLTIDTGTTRILVPPGENRSFDDFAWSPDGRTIAGVTDEGAIELVDTTLGYGPTLEIQGPPPTHLTWSPDGSRLSFWLGFGATPYDLPIYELALLDARPGARLSRVPGVTTRAPDALAWSPDGARFAVWRETRR